MKYPQVMSEEATLANCELKSIARFGDGEWRCAVGGGCTSQRADPKLARELQTILKGDLESCMVGIPNPFHADAPRRESWIKYTQSPFSTLLSKRVYWSSFITRPDNAPWIDTPQYWANVGKLWDGVGVTLVVGAAKDGNGEEKKSITTEMIGDSAKWVRLVIGPRQHAYSEIDRIEKEIIANDPGRVLLCLGVTATVLAYRLAKRGIHALDVGHIGMFMRHAGAYRYVPDDLASPAYREQLAALHTQRSWGADGAKHTNAVKALIDEVKPQTILDYGCSESKLAEALKPVRVSGYDPGIPERAKMPKPCDLVVCTDVLEHVEPEKIDNVLDHIFRLTGKAAYFVISTRPANAVLPDGRNAHLLIEPASYWIDKLKAQSWRLNKFESSGKELRVWLGKP